MSKSKVRYKPNPSTNPRLNEQASVPNKQRAPVSGSKPRAGSPPADFLFHKNHFIWMGAGIALIALGLILMSGGEMQDPNVWDESIIYSPVRITVAPILIICGLIIEIFAIFRK